MKDLSPSVIEAGYQTAFYELARMMDIPAQPMSPEAVWEHMMKPRLRAMLAVEADPAWVEMREALQPFAAIANDGCLQDHEDTYAPRPSRGRPCMSDYRRAARALALTQAAQADSGGDGAK